MSRKDPRKALTIRLPDHMRRALIGQGPDWRPLPGLMRRALMNGLNARATAKKFGLTVCQPGDMRPILLQLSHRERRLLQNVSEAEATNLETTALMLIHAGLQLTATSSDTDCGGSVDPTNK